jgi:bifunctional DNA primase/polymerase-like protein
MTTRPDPANPMLAAALQYAQADWPVFPCVQGQKVPATGHGFLDATTDPDKITWWWSSNPERNVAIATGRPGPDVLDVDVHRGGSGFAAFNRLRRAGFLEGASAYVRTPSGGLHAYFTGSEQGTGRLPAHHLDFRSRGGYVVAPPSHIGGRPYELLTHQQGQAGLDWAEVTRLLEPQPQRRPERTVEGPADASRLAGWVARLPEGNRNDGLFWAANRALDAGVTDLGELAEAARSTGLDEGEIARTLTSARRHAAPSFGADRTASGTPEPASRPPEAERPAPGSPNRATRSQPGRGPEAEAI